VWRSAESPNAAIGYVLGQAGAPGVDHGVTCLPFGAVQSRFDGTVARPWIEALELDRYVVDTRIGGTPVDTMTYIPAVRALVLTRLLAVPPGDIAALPERLDGMLIVMRAHERDGRGRGYAIKDGQAGQGGAGAPVAPRAGDFNPLTGGALPGFGQDRQHLGPVGGQAEVGPSEPSRFPRDDRRWPTE
jgi:hypothetical protein